MTDSNLSEKEFIQMRDEALQKQLQEFYLKQILADCEIHCGDKVFKVNKSILCASSEVFNQMFSTTGLKEKLTNIVELNRYRPEVIDNLLRFVYSFNELPNIEEMSQEVLEAAEFYDIMGLKKLASKFVIKTLDKSNYFKRLVSAWLHKNTDLKNEILRFISENPNECDVIELLNSDDWKNFQKDHQETSKEVMKSLLGK